MIDTWYNLAVSEYRLSGKIASGDPFWKTFNASFHNVEMKPEMIMRTISMGRPVTTQHANKWRHSDNYLMGQHIGLDFDNEDETSTIQHLVKDKFVQKYASFVHTTVSHQPDKPRARVIFLLSEPIHQAKNYALAASAILWLFGTADRQCKDPVRFFYGALDCEFEYLGNELPLEMVKQVIKRYVDSGSHERKRTTRPNYLPPASQQEVADALRLIDPWQIDYGEWVSILMALHSQFGEGGYMLAESWADGQGGEVERKWKSFKQAGNASGQVTIATVFGIAKRFGWNKFDNSAAV